MTKRRMREIIAEVIPAGEEVTGAEFEAGLREKIAAAPTKRKAKEYGKILKCFLREEGHVKTPRKAPADGQDAAAGNSTPSTKGRAESGNAASEMGG